MVGHQAVLNHSTEADGSPWTLLCVLAVAIVFSIFGVVFERNFDDGDKDTTMTTTKRDDIDGAVAELQRQQQQQQQKETTTHRAGGIYARMAARRYDDPSSDTEEEKEKTRGHARRNSKGRSNSSSNREKRRSHAESKGSRDRMTRQNEKEESVTPQKDVDTNNAISFTITPVETYTKTHYLALILQAALAFLAAYFDYLGIAHAPAGDAMALFSLCAVWTPLLESAFKKQKPANQVNEEEIEGAAERRSAGGEEQKTCRGRI